MQCQNPFFNDRQDAGKALQEIMPMEQMKNEEWAIISVSSGGLDLAQHLESRFHFHKDFLFTASIFAPNNPECEIARVSETEEIVMHDALVNAFDIQVDYVYGEAQRKYEEKVLSAMFQYRHGRHFELCKDKTILLIDEGSETGLKFMVAIKSILAMQPKAVYIAVPVIPTDVLEALEPLVDEIFYLHALSDYVQTSCYYSTLESVSDERIEEILGEEKHAL